MLIPVAPNNFNFTVNININNDPITKLGIVIPKVAIIIHILSGHLFAFNAAITPSNIPTTTDATIAIAPTLADFGKPFSIVSITSLPLYFIDCPKSPFNKPFI